MVDHQELQQAKDFVFNTMRDKEKLEADLKEQKDILDRNNVGMDEPLVDSEGYPRQDIDVYQVRHARQKIICLMNDHKALMKKITEGLHNVHALAGHQENSTSATSSAKERVELEPFLRVYLVCPGSPAELAGLHNDDLILEFGSISYQNFQSLNDIMTLVQNSRYKPVHVKIKRGSNVIVLSLTPRPWYGNGLVGCNIIPLESVER